MDIVMILETVHWIAIAILFFLLVYTCLQKPSEMQKHLVVLTIAMILMILGFNMELDAISFESARYAAFIYYVGEPFLLLSEFMMLCTFYGRKVPKWLFIPLTLLALSIPVLVYTNPLHHLYYTALEYNPDAKFSCLVYTHGPLYFLNIGTSIIFFISYIAVIATGFEKCKSPAKKRLSLYSTLMVLSGILGFVIYTFNIADGYDTTIMGLTVGVAFLFIMFFKCRIFDIVDMAKDYALEISNDGLMVFDDSDTIVYENAAAARVLKEGMDRSYIENLKTEKSICRSGDQVYNLNVHEMNKDQIYIGKSIEISNITDSYENQARLEAAVKEATWQLERTQRAILGSIANIVEARSLETGDHIRRVSDYTEKIARTLQNTIKYEKILTDHYIETLTLSAPLHDVGKISVSDTILLKPGRLTPEEFEEMKKHSANGAKIIRTTMAGLESEEYINMAGEIALYHHERWDGTGYPTGLSGEAIPLSARIVALADCYDAMTSKRCYKDAFSEEKALTIIKEERGTHFDPDVVDAFLRS